MDKEFNDKVALVTGGGYGIGRAAAIAFAQRGANTVVADIDADNGKETVERIKKAGVESIFIKTDVSLSNDVKALIDNTIAKYGRLDFAFNNAGIHGEFIPTVDFTEEEWDRMININLKSVWLCMKYEIPQMLKQGKGSIVNTSSVAGLVGVPSNPAYPASKHGVVGLTRSTALEYAKTGIRVNCVCPGPIRTGMHESLIKTVPDIVEMMHEKVPMARIGEPEEIAGAVMWLCSESASYVTGHALPVDGGIVVG